LLAQKGVGPALADKAAAALSGDHTAEACGGLEQREVDALTARPTQLDQAMRGGKAADTAAHHGDARHALVHWRTCAATTAASVRMKSGWSWTAGARTSSTPSAAAVCRASTSRSSRTFT